MANLFDTFLYQPTFQALVWIYQTIALENIGLALILLTIAIRIILYPLFYKQAEQAAVMQKVQPKIKEIQKKHKDNKEEQGVELSRLFKENKVNPFSGFVILLVQLPIMIAIFQVIRKELTNGAFADTMFLGIDLATASIPMAIIAAAFQYVHAKMTMPGGKKLEGGEKDAAATTGKMMTYLAPGITLVILARLPAALGIYWITSTIVGIGQQYVVNKKIKSKEKVAAEDDHPERSLKGKTEGPPNNPQKA
jgi:YidC/Oxa1 family membrane protein insertase